MFENNISLTFLFNPWKHHLKWMAAQIAEYIKTGDDIKHENGFISKVTGLNNNYIDLYTGNLTPNEIIEQVKIVIKNKVLDPTDFYNAILSNSYELIILNDESVWVLRKGEIVEPSIHIHPAKFTKHSIRVHGISLKTAILLTMNHIQLPQLEEINEIRKNYLQLSPIKNIQSTGKVFTAIGLLKQEMNLHTDLLS
jgi:hypothetical protein